MRIGIATDHGWVDVKESLSARVRVAGHDVLDFGAHLLNSGDDHPEFVIPLADAVAAGRVERGIALSGSGVGASVCANKVPGVRAAFIPGAFSARQRVEDDRIDIICRAGGRLAPPLPGSWFRRLSKPNSAARNATFGASPTRWPPANNRADRKPSRRS